MENNIMSANVVFGEAAESDTEDPPNVLEVNSSTGKGTVVTGEDSESEDESIKITQPSVSTSSFSAHLASSYPHDSLLHKKFSECYLSIYSNINSLVKNLIKDSLVKLSITDRELLRSQLRLQEVVGVLKKIDSTGISLAEKLNNAACSAYIPKITISVEIDSD